MSFGQAPGEAGLDRDRGQRVAEQVVQVAGDARALVLRGEPGHFGTSFGKFLIAADQPEEAVHRQADQRDRDQRSEVEPGVPGPHGRWHRHRDHDEQHQQRDRPPGQRSDGQYRDERKHDEGVLVGERRFHSHERERRRIHRPEALPLAGPDER